MATEAAIPEPVPMTITEVELENKYLTGKMHAAVVDELKLGEFKKVHPLETHEFSEQTDNIEIASDLPFEPVKEKDTNIFGNFEGECSSKSPSEANLGHEEASTIVEYSQADAFPFQAEKKTSMNQTINDEVTEGTKQEAEKMFHEEAEDSSISHDVFNPMETSNEKPNFETREEENLKEVANHDVHVEQEDIPVQKDLSEENGTTREGNLLANEFTEKNESIEADLEDVPVSSLSSEEEETKGCKKQENFEPEEVGEANEASREEAKHTEEISGVCQSTHVENTETTEPNPQRSGRDLEKPQDIDEVKCEENNTEENIEETVQNMEEACNAESRETTTKSDESTISINGADLVGEESVKQKEGVLLEAASVLGVENKREKTEVYAENNDFMAEEVQDGTETTCITEATDEKVVTGHIKEEIVPSSHEEEDSREEIITPINTNGDPSEGAEGDIEQAEWSQTEILDGYRTEKASESSANDTGPPPVRDILDASIVKQEESLEGGFKNLPQTEASPEDKNEIPSASLSSQSSNDTELIKVEESLEECKDDFKQNLEILDTPIVIQERPLTGGESLNPNGALADEERDEEISSALENDRIDKAVVEVKQNLEEGEDNVKLNSQTNENLVMKREETDRDFELKEENVQTWEEDSEQLLHKNEAEEILDASMAEQEKYLQDQGKNLNEVETSTRQKRTDDSVEENVNDEPHVENVENAKQDSQDIEAVAPNGANLDESIFQNLDESTEKEKIIEHSTIEEIDGVKTPEYPECTGVVAPIADHFKEEVDQNLDEAIQKEEPEELSKENQVQEMPECSEYTTEVVTPNTDNLEEEIAQVQDQTPRNVEEPEERTRENKVDEKLKEETYEINQPEDTEIPSSEGHCTAEDKNYGEPEKEMQDEVKISCIQDVEKEEPNIEHLPSEVVQENPVKEFQDNEEEAEKSEIFEGSDTGGVSDIITRDQIQDGDQEHPITEGESQGPKGASADEETSSVLENDQIDEAVIEVEQNLEEGKDDVKLNQQTAIMREETNSDFELNKEENVQAREEDSEQLLHMYEAGPILDASMAEEEKNFQDQGKSLNEDSATTAEENVNEEQPVEAVAQNAANLDERYVQTTEKEENFEESTIEENDEAKTPEYPEHTGEVAPIADNLKEEDDQNLDETTQTEEPEELSKENQVQEMPECSEYTEVVTPNNDNLEEEIAQALDQTPRNVEEFEEGTRENKVDETLKKETYEINQPEDTEIPSSEGHCTAEDKNYGEPEKEMQDKVKISCIQDVEKEEPNIEHLPSEVVQEDPVKDFQDNEEEAEKSEIFEGSDTGGVSGIITQDQIQDGDQEHPLTEGESLGPKGASADEETSSALENDRIDEAVIEVEQNLEEGKDDVKLNQQTAKMREETNSDFELNKEENVQAREEDSEQLLHMYEAGPILDASMAEEEKNFQDQGKSLNEGSATTAKENVNEESPVETVAQNAANLDERYVQTTKKEENFEESTIEESDEAKAPEYPEHTRDVAPIADNLKEEDDQNLDETTQTEEPEELSKENQVQEMPECSEYTEVVTPNNDNLEEEIAQALDQTPRNVEEFEEGTRENKVDETLKEETYEINQPEDTEIPSSEGHCTAEEKNYGEPEKEMQDEVKISCIQDVEKEEPNIEHLPSEVVQEDPVKDFQDNEEEAEKSEIFEGSDTGSVSDIITRDQIQDGDQEHPLTEGESLGPKGASADEETSSALENDRIDEAVIEVEQNLEEGEDVAKLNQRTAIMREETNSDFELNKEENVQAREEDSEQLLHMYDAGPILDDSMAEEEKNFQDQGKSLNEGSATTAEENVNEEPPVEAVAQNAANLDERYVQTTEKEENFEESTIEENDEAKTPEYPEHTGEVAPIADNLKEEDNQNPDETTQTEEPEELSKENQVQEMPECSEYTEVVIPNTDNLEEEIAQALDQTPQNVEEFEEGTRENKVDETLKEETYEINQPEDTEITSSEGHCTAEDKNYGEPEKEMQDEVKISCIQDVDKEEPDIEHLPSEVVQEDPVKEFQDNEEEAEKSEIFEGSDTGGVSDIITRDQIQDGDQEHPLTEGESLGPKGASADEETSSVLENDQIDEAVIEVEQNLEEGKDDVKLNQQTVIMREETNSDFELNKKENVQAREEDSEQLLHMYEAGPILDASMAEEEKNFQDQGKSLNEGSATTAEENVNEEPPVEAVAQNAVNLDERYVQTTEKDEFFEESTIEESDEAKTPEYPEHTGEVAPIADNLKEEDDQNLDETSQTEEPEELSKENQVQEMPECSEYTEVVTPNNDNLEEEIAQSLDQTPRNVEEFEEGTRENKVDETLKEETTYVINQSEDTEILSNEGPSTAEDKDYGEPAKEMQDDVETSCIQDAEKEEPNTKHLPSEVVPEDPVKDFQDNEEEAEKSEIFEGSDTGGVSDIITQDQIQDDDEGDVRGLKETPEKEGITDESFVEDGKVTEVLEVSEGDEEIMHMATSLEEGASQNLEETGKQNSEEGILSELASILSVEDENKNAENNGLTTEEVQVVTQTTSIGEVTDEQVITEPIKEETDPSSQDCEKEAKIYEQEDSREEILNQINTRDVNLEAVEEDTEQAEKFEREVSRDAEAIAPPADSDEGDVRDLEEIQEKEGNSEESSVEDDKVKKVPEDSEGNEVVMQISSSLDEGLSQNIGETLDKEETTEDSSKNDEVVLNEPEESENTESTTPVVGNLKETTCQNLEEIIDKEENIEDSSKEDDMVAMVLEDSEDSKAVTSVDGNLKESIQYFEETLVKEDNTEESSNKDNKARDLDEAAGQTLEKSEEKEDNTEESSKQDNSVAIMPENSEGAEAVTQDAGNLEGAGQNLEETIENEDDTGEGPKQEIQATYVPENSDGAELVTLIGSNLEEAEGQNLEQNQEKEDNTRANEPKNSESTEAVSQIARNLEKEAGQNLEKNTEESSQQDDKVAYVPENSECTEIVTSIYNNLEDGAGQNIEETIEKEENTEESSEHDDKVANVLENSECAEDVTPVYSNLEEGVDQNIEETIETQENTEESSQQDDKVADVPENSEDTEAVTPIYSNLEEGACQNIEETIEKEENAEESSQQDDNVADVPKNSECTEAVTPILSNLEEKASQNIEETVEKEENSEERSQQDDKVADVAENSEYTAVITQTTSNLEEGVSQDIEETRDKEDNAAENYKEDDTTAKTIVPIACPLEDEVQDLEETLTNVNNIKESSKEEYMVAKELENTESPEATTPIAINLEERACQNLEAQEKEDYERVEDIAPAPGNLQEVSQNLEETSEENTVASAQEESESTIVHDVCNFEEGAFQTLGESRDKGVSEESSKHEDAVETILEDSEGNEATTQMASNLEERAVANLDETSDNEGNINESSNEDTVEKMAEDSERTVEVAGVSSSLEEVTFQNLEEPIDNYENTEERSKEEDKVANVLEEGTDVIAPVSTYLEVGARENSEEILDKEDSLEERGKQDAMVANLINESEGNVEVPSDADNLDREVFQNLEESLNKEGSKESIKEEDTTTIVSKDVEETNEVALVATNFEEMKCQNLEETQDIEDRNKESANEEGVEAVTTIASNSEEGVVQNFEEKLEKEKNTEEDSQEDNMEPMTPKEEECEMIQTENVTEQNIEEVEKTKDTEASPVSIDLEETAVQNLEEIIYKGKTQESSKEEDNVEKVPVDVYDTEAVTSNDDNLKGKVAETIDYNVENKTNDLESTEDTPAGNLEESVVPDFNENLDKEKNIEEGSEEANKVPMTPKEEGCEMIQIEDITKPKMAEESAVNEEFTSNDRNLDGQVVENLENKVEYMPEDSADTEATPTEITLVEKAAPNFEECLDKAHKIEEIFKEDSVALTNSEEDCETIQTEDITKSNTEEDNVEKTETTEASSTAENLNENSVQILDETPNKEKIEESSKEEDDVEKTPDKPNVTEASDNENLEGKAVENLNDNVEYMIEATPASDKLEETFVSNFEEKLVEGNNEENSKEDAKMPTPKEEDGETIQTEAIREQNIEEDNAAEDKEILEERSSNEVCEELETAVLSSSNITEKSEQATEKDEDVIDDSVMQEISEKDNEEEISGELDTKLNDSASAFIIVERDGTSHEEAELGEEIQEESSSLASQEVSLEVAETTGTISEGLDTSVSEKILVETEKASENVEYEKQDIISEAQSGGLIEEGTCETMLKHSSEDEHELGINETSETRDETSTEAQAPCESMEDPFTSQARDEINIEEEDRTTDLINDSDSISVDEAVGNKSGENLRVHPEPDIEHFVTNSEDMEISKREDAIEDYNLRESSGTKSFDNEQSSNVGLENEKIEDGDKDIIEPQNFTEVVAESSEGIEVENETADETLAEVSIINSSGPAATTTCSSELVAGGIISEKILSQDENNQNESDGTDVKCEEDDKEIKLEQNPDLEPEYNEQDTRETEKAVIWAEQVKEAVEKADNKETIKEVIEEESAVHELHMVKEADLLETTRDEPVGKGSEDEQIGGSDKPVEVFIAPPEESQGTVDQMTEQNQHDNVDTASAFETTTTADISLRETQADDLPSTENVAIQQGGLVHEMRPVENFYVTSELPTTDPIQQTDEETEASGQGYVSKNQESKETVDAMESLYAKKLNEGETKETEEDSDIVPDHKSQDGEAVFEHEIIASPTLPTGIPEEELQTLSASEQQMQVITIDRGEENEVKQVEGPGDESPEVSSFRRTTEETCLQMEARDLTVSDFDFQPSDDNIKHIHEEEKGTLDIVAEDKEVSQIVSKFESESIDTIQGDEIACDQAVEMQTISSTSTFENEEHETAADPTLPLRISDEQHQTSSNETTGTIENAEKKVNEVEILQRESPENFTTIETTEDSHAVLTESENTDIDAMHPQAETADFKSKDDPREKIIKATEIEQDKDTNYQLHKEIETADAEVKIMEQVSLVEKVVENETETVSLTAERDGVAEAPIPRDEESVVGESMAPTEASELSYLQDKTSQTELEKPSLIQSEQNPITKVVSTTAFDSSLMTLSDLMEKSSRQLQQKTTEQLPTTDNEETLIEKEEKEEIPVIVEASRDSSSEVEVPAAHNKKEKSNNILSKVKHSISKVKKAITGKSTK